MNMKKVEIEKENLNQKELNFSNQDSLIFSELNFQELKQEFQKEKALKDFEKLINIPILQEYFNAYNGLKLFDIYQEAIKKPLHHRIAYLNTPLKYKIQKVGKNQNCLKLDLECKVKREILTGQKKQEIQFVENQLTKKNKILYDYFKKNSKTARLGRKSTITQMDKRKQEIKNLKIKSLEYQGLLKNAKRQKDKKKINLEQIKLKSNLTRLHKKAYLSYYSNLEKQLNNTKNFIVNSII